MASQITVRNLQRAVPVNVSGLRKSAQQLFDLVVSIRQRKRTTLDQLSELSVLLISDRRMTALHQQFLQQEGPTDVITFEHGEIFISTETARRNARAFGNSLARELQLCVVHGLLHLHGFDDSSAVAAREMKQTQEKILRRLVR
jgi:probable rRNA maturation factor